MMIGLHACNGSWWLFDTDSHDEMGPFVDEDGKPSGLAIVMVFRSRVVAARQAYWEGRRN